MIMPSSFLHAASAKALTNNSPHRQQSITSTKTVGGLRLLLVEEDSSLTNDNDNIGSSSPTIMHRHRHPAPALAYSLIMDAACAIVSSSTLSCRGCDIKMKSGNDDEKTTTRSNNDKQCRCCKVVLLIPGSTKQSRKRRRNKMKYRNDTNDYINSQQQLVASLAADKIPFPIHCNPSSNNNNNTTHDDNKEEWKEHILHQIQIKYVHSYSDIIKYLAYAPSLPEWLQPLDGIFILGLGELLSSSRGDGGSSLTEMTHVLSLLADTGDALESNRNELLSKASSSSHNNPLQQSERITLMATLSEYTYKSLPKRMTCHLHQWMDYVALIQSCKSDGGRDNRWNEDVYDDNTTTTTTTWELVVKACTVFDHASKDYGEKRTTTTTSSLFKVANYYDAQHELCHEIVWNV